MHIDGASFYANQSTARGIGGLAQVEEIAISEAVVFDALVLPYLPASRDAVIYEAATGPGILQCWLRDKGYSNRQGSDFSEFEAGIASSITPSINHADSIDDLEGRITDDSCGAIIALDFFEHLPREHFVNFIRIAHEKLVPGGVLILRGPNGDSPFVGRNLYNDITHVWAYTSGCLERLLKLAGFNDVEFADNSAGELHLGVSWKKPILRVAQWMLSFLIRIATRQQINYWGSSIYVYARKTS